MVWVEMYSKKWYFQKMVRQQKTKNHPKNHVPFNSMKQAQTDTATTIKKGRICIDRTSGLSAPKINFDIMTWTSAAVMAPNVGEATQASKVLRMASVPKLSAPRVARPTATRPPTIECVAEMGNPYTVARSVVDPAPARTHNIPNAKVKVPLQPSAAYACGSMTP